MILNYDGRLDRGWEETERERKRERNREREKETGERDRKERKRVSKRVYRDPTLPGIRGRYKRHGTGRMTFTDSEKITTVTDGQIHLE